LSFLRRLRRQQPGAVIQASTINRIADAAEYANRIRATSPITVKHTPAGPLIGITAYKGFLAVANGAIPAATSATNFGVGSVYIVQLQATFSAGGAMATCTGTTYAGVSLAVYNPSRTKMSSGNGIDSGQTCWIQQDASGFYLVTPLECS
jgi:hypothetical protein